MMSRFRAFAIVALVLVGSGASAWAQPAPPPPVNDLAPARPWTYVMGRGLAAIALLTTVGLVLGYLVKAREFRANMRRGGAK